MELIRTWVRDVIGYRSSLYRLAARCLDTYFALYREGLQGLKLLALRSRSGEAVSMRFRHLEHPILIKPGTEDVASIINNVFRQEYGQLPKEFSPQVIVDAGAYVGDTAAYYLSRFPKARIIALEPNGENYRCAVRNLEPYGDRVVLLNRALWSTETVVRLSGASTGASISDRGVEVQTETIPTLMQEYEVDEIDILKMDIEGAEASVIPSGVGDGGWLRKTKKVLLETHGVEIENKVLPVLEAEGFSCKRHRNVWYCERILSA